MVVLLPFCHSISSLFLSFYISALGMSFSYFTNCIITQLGTLARTSVITTRFRNKISSRCRKLGTAKSHSSIFGEQRSKNLRGELNYPQFFPTWCALLKVPLEVSCIFSPPFYLPSPKRFYSPPLCLSLLNFFSTTSLRFTRYPNLTTCCVQELFHLPI